MEKPEVYVLGANNLHSLEKAIVLSLGDKERYVVILEIASDKPGVYATKLTATEAWNLASYVGIIRKLKSDEIAYKEKIIREL